MAIPAGEGHADFKCPGVPDGWFDAVNRCAKHPRYRAIGKPRSPCEGCWRLYVEAHPITWFT